MKRVFLLVALVVSGLGFSQEISVGAKTGLNINSVSGDLSNPKMTTGFHAGLTGELKLADRFSIQPELLYSTQGGEVSRTIDAINFFAVTQVKSSYLNLPVMGKFYITDNFTVEAGPQIGFLMGSKANIRTFVKTSILDIPILTKEFDTKERTAQIDYAVNFGLGYKLDNGINFGARYSLGLTNFNDGGDQNIQGTKLEDLGVAAALGNNKLKNNVIQVYVGYSYSFL